MSTLDFKPLLITLCGSRSLVTPILRMTSLQVLSGLVEMSGTLLWEI